MTQVNAGRATDGPRCRRARAKMNGHFQLAGGSTGSEGRFLAGPGKSLNRQVTELKERKADLTVRERESRSAADRAEDVASTRQAHHRGSDHSWLLRLVIAVAIVAVGMTAFVGMEILVPSLLPAVGLAAAVGAGMACAPANRRLIRTRMHNSGRLMQGIFVGVLTALRYASLHVQGADWAAAAGGAALAARPAAIPFWGVLDPTERDVLRSVASVRTFAAGATIVQQGEQADHVLVILEGRASIRVNENGKERVLAERGRGQLVGERGALQVSTRSASVVVLEMIRALVVQTRDFAAFLSSNQHVLAFVEEQSRGRGTDLSDGYHNRESAGFADGMTAGQLNDVPAGHQQSLRGQNCTVICTDVVGFGASSRTDGDRSLIREALFRMIQEATQDLSDVRSEDRGDGTLIVIPPNVPTAKAIDELVRVLPGALDQHNSSQRNRNTARFQLRLSVSVGPVESDTVGVSGETIIVASRLVEAPAFKEAFKGSTARLGIIVSRFVYDTVIRHSRDEDYAASYFEIPVEVKEFRTTAWMKLIG